MKKTSLYTLLMFSTILTSTARGMETEDPHSTRSTVPQQGDVVVRVEPEVPGRYHYDGRSVARGRITVKHYQNGYREAVFARDGEIRGHEGNTINYVELFATGNELPSRLIGDYDFKSDLEFEKKLRGREQGSLVYSDGGGNYYLPHVTQERWERERSYVGAFISSHNPEKHKIRFLTDARILNGETPIQTPLPIGLYNITSVNESDPHRKEVWKKLGVGGETFTITSPLGCSSIPGMGTFVPRFVAHDHANEGALRIYNKIEESERRLRTLDTHSEAESTIIFFGPTGRGKTTLTHILAGRQLNVVDTDNGPRPQAEGANRLSDDFRISHDGITGTEYPAVWYDAVNRRNIIDCPGFGDVRGGGEDIVNAFSINQILKSQNKFKVVLVVREGDVTGRGKELQDLLKHVNAIFLDKTALKSSISLVVTQHQSAKLDKVLKSKAITITQGDSSLDLLNFFVAHPKTVSSLPLQLEEGPYKCPIAIEGVESAINNTMNVLHPKDSIHVTLDDGAKLLIKGLAEKLNEHLEKDIKIKASQEIINKAKNIVENHQGPLSDLRNNLHTFADHFSNLQGETALSAEEFLKRLSTFIDIKDIQKTFDHMTFLNKIGANVRYEVNNWVLALTSVIKKIRYFAAPPEVNVDSEVLSVKGSLIDSSDIKTAFQVNPTVNKIQAFASNRLFIDQDLTASGKSVALIAPRWEIPSDRNVTINLNGLPQLLRGQDGAPGAPGSTGGDGKPGLPGGNGGHFYGKGFKISNPNRLTITSNSGTGGTGGNGGPGGNGAPGVDGNLQTVTAQRNHKTPSFKQGGRRYDYRGDLYTYNDQGTDGKMGGSGGQNGKGGLGGHSGVISMNFPLNGWSTTANSGNPGNDGVGGTGGQGGIHGKHCQGTVFVNKILYKHRNGHFWASPDEIITPLQHVDRQSAPNGPNSVQLNPQAPANPIPLTDIGELEILTAYKTDLSLKAKNPNSSPFVEVFPGLGAWITNNNNNNNNN